MERKREAFSCSCDVLVAGGGMAGVAAAVAAGRAGLKTVLVEKGILFGGLATAGLVLIYLPLSDSRGKQVTFGLAEELLHCSLRYGPGEIPSDWRNPQTPSRYGVEFSPAAFVLALDEILAEARVELWVDTLITDVVMDADRITGVEIYNKSGKGIIHAHCFIDATGDADVAYLAGAPCIEQDNWMSFWSLQASLDSAKDAVSKNMASPLCTCKMLGACDNGQGAPEGMRKYYGTRGKDVSEFVLEGRKILRDYYRKTQATLGPTGRQEVFPITLPSMAQFRTTRRIEGLATLDTNHSGRHFDDSTGILADWRGGQDLWEVPYRTLLPQKIQGLLAAGRCISAAGEAWQVTRVIQAAAMTGQVAGLAASLSVKQQILPHRLEVNLLQQELEKHQFLLNLHSLNRTLL
jgi:hypothetical protein